MREFKLGKGSVTIPLESTGQIKVRASSKKEITLWAVSGSEEIPIAHGCTLDLKETLSAEFDSVKLSVYGQGTFGYWIEERMIRGHDPLNDDDPPALPEPKADNLVAQLHRMMKNQSRNGVTVLEPDSDNPFLNRYVIDDNDFSFEDDPPKPKPSVPQQTEPQKRSEKPKSGETISEDTTPSDPPKRPPEPKSGTSEGSGKPPTPKIAAE